MARMRVIWALPLILLAGSVRPHPQVPVPAARSVSAQVPPTPDPLGRAGRVRHVSERRRHREEMEQRAVAPRARDEACPQAAPEKEG